MVLLLRLLLRVEVALVVKLGLPSDKLLLTGLEGLTFVDKAARMCGHWGALEASHFRLLLWSDCHMQRVRLGGGTLRNRDRYASPSVLRGSGLSNCDDQWQRGNVETEDEGRSIHIRNLNWRCGGSG